MSATTRIELIGGPTVLIEISGLRLLTDPTFSAPGPQGSGAATLTKLTGPARSPEGLGRIDAVLLSHDQHADNLDDAGRAVLAPADRVITTQAAAERLGDNAVGLSPWTRMVLPRPDGSELLVTAVPAVHGPEGMGASSGPVIGFVLRGDGIPTVYISGDNASLRLVEEVAHHLGPVDIAILFAGGARAARLDAFLTFTSSQLPQAARILGAPHIVPAHSEGWAHLTDDQPSIAAAFAAAGMSDVLHLLKPGQGVDL